MSTTVADAVQYSADWTEVRSDVRRFIHRWLPSSKPIGSVCIVHGLGEHGGRYNRLALDLAANQFAVFAIDQQGHGRSTGKQGCIESYESLLDDIGAFLGWVKKTVPDRDAFLFGHSMGGNLVTNYVLRRDDLPPAVVVSSPMFRSPREPSWLVDKFARALLFFAPNHRLKSQVLPKRLMSDPAEQIELEQDTYFHTRLSLKLGAALVDTGRWAIKNASKLSIPMLLTHGTDDYLTSPEASAEFAKQAGEECQLELLEGHLHDPFRDVRRGEVIEIYLDFLRRFARV